MKNKEIPEKYHTIIVGGGASGLYFASRFHLQKPCAILEKTDKPGKKLLLSGSGQCNLTHAGSIKDFLQHYGQNGAKIRSCLYKHNNIAVQNYFESLQVPVCTREDGKVFPSSMNARQVLHALLTAVHQNQISVFCRTGVTQIKYTTHGYLLSSGNDRFLTQNLVIAAGGCSYPATGSDGSIFQILQKDLGIHIVTPQPALVPVCPENYPFSSLSGVSLKNIQIKTGSLVFAGDLLFTHKAFSGPVILNHSRYMKKGTRLEINYLFPYTIYSVISQMKVDFPGNHKTIETYLAEKYFLPRRFIEILTAQCGIKSRKVSTLKGFELENLCETLCQSQYRIKGNCGFQKAMVTAGGVSCDEVNLHTMESLKYPGLYFIGEVLDIDGDTGGYNLQFAFSSAAAASSHIEEKNQKERYAE